MKTYKEFVTPENQKILRNRLRIVLSVYPYHWQGLASLINAGPKTVERFVVEEEDIQFKTLSKVENFVLAMEDIIRNPPKQKINSAFIRDAVEKICNKKLIG